MRVMNGEDGYLLIDSPSSIVIRSGMGWRKRESMVELRKLN